MLHPSLLVHVMASAAHLEGLSIFSPASISSRAQSRPGLLECKEFYINQSQHALGDYNDRQKVPIYVSSTVHRDWIPYLKAGIAVINEACPGLHLFLAEKAESMVVIQGSTDGNCYTLGNILWQTREQVLISLDHGESLRWNKKRTSVHELLHALGAQHEHQAEGADTDFVDRDPQHEQYDPTQYDPISQFEKITRRDPFSIMMYPEGCRSCLSRKEHKDMVWDLKRPGEINDEMSELDKVGLNQVYPPCRSATYNPVRSSVTGLWYCGRRVMQNHNRPAASTTDDRCGPNNGANCPACRSLKNRVVNFFCTQNGRWQGWSGLVYCGEYFGEKHPGHDGFCGPNNGPPCPQCESILLPTTAAVSFYSAKTSSLAFE